MHCTVRISARTREAKKQAIMDCAFNIDAPVAMETHLLSNDNVDDDTNSKQLPDDVNGKFIPRDDENTFKIESHREHLWRDSHRILDRDGGANQSLGKWQIDQETGTMKSMMGAFGFCQDWFHTLLYTNTAKVCLYLGSLYTFIIFFFGFVYLMVSKIGAASLAHQHAHNSSGDRSSSSGSTVYCGMSITNHMEALYFSLSTMTTIGYGVSDYYFGDCWLPLALVLCQVLTAIMFDSLAIGVIFLRLSKSKKRARSIIFSDTAVIRRLKGKLYLIFQLAEMRRQHLLEAQIRVYCVRHHRYPSHGSTGPVWKEDNSKQYSNKQHRPNAQIQTSFFHTHHIQLLHPHTGNTSSLFMPLPNVILHALDSKSPLRPKRIWYDKNGKRHVRGQLKSSSYHYATEEYISSNLSTCTATTSSLSCASSISSLPTTKTRRINLPLLPPQPEYDNCEIDQFISEQAEIEAFMKDREAELVVFVEGTDEITGSALQARHSYKWDDIFWNQTFAPCVTIAPSKSKNSFCGSNNEKHDSMLEKCVIDFTNFHNLIPAPLDCMTDALLDFVHEEGESDDDADDE